MVGGALCYDAPWQRRKAWGELGRVSRGVDRWVVLGGVGGQVDGDGGKRGVGPVDVMSSMGKLKLIGRRERISLPEWGLKRVRAKIDTGARTSAIDVAQIEHLDDGRIRFEVVYRVKPKRVTRWVEAMPVRTSMVKPSHGKAHERIVCRTKMCMGAYEQDVEISLICRKGMLCRMLIGRTALAGRFAVDASSKYLLSRPEKKRLTQ